MGDAFINAKVTMLMQMVKRRILIKFFPINTIQRLFIFSSPHKQTAVPGRSENLPGAAVSMTSLFPVPLVYVVNDRPPVSVGMDLLIRDLQSVSHEVQMIHIAEPDPRNITFLCNARRTVPLSLFP